MSSVSNSDNFKIFSGNSNQELATRVANQLSINLGKAEITKFSDGETKVVIQENVRKQHCFIVQSTGPSSYGSPNDMFMELCIMIDALKRGSAESVNVVMPYYGYSRQDRKDYSRAPISARVVATMLESLGINRVIVFDLHAYQIQGFFSSNTPVDNLTAEPYFIKYINDNIIIKDTNLNNYIIVSPDEGGVKRANRVADKIGLGLAIIHKERSQANVIDRMELIGNVSGKIVVMIDDMIDTGGTACKAAHLLKERGATEIYMLVTHGIFSGTAFKKIKNSDFTKVVATNTLELRQKLASDCKIEIIDISKMCAEAIRRSLLGESISDLYNGGFNKII